MQPMPMKLTPSNHTERMLTSKETWLLLKIYYVQVLKSAPTEGWNGKDGTIADDVDEDEEGRNASSFLNV